MQELIKRADGLTSKSLRLEDDVLDAEYEYDKLVLYGAAPEARFCLRHLCSAFVS